MIDTKVEVINPKIAQRFLASWAGNRKISQYIVDRYARSMTNDEWSGENGESIKFDREGRMIDGQHRMQAIIQSNKSIRMLVVRNVDHEAFATIDSGKNRTVGDVVSIAGFANANQVSAIAAAIIQLDTIGKIDYAVRLRPSKKEIIEFVSEHDDILQNSARVASRSKAMSLLGPTVPGLIHAKASMAGLGDKATDFLNQLGSGIFDNETDLQTYPVYILRQKMIAIRSSGRRMQMSEVAAWTIKAWNAFLAKKRSQVLRYTSSEEFPSMLLKASK